VEWWHSVQEKSALKNIEILENTLKQIKPGLVNIGIDMIFINY